MPETSLVCCSVILNGSRFTAVIHGDFMAKKCGKNPLSEMCVTIWLKTMFSEMEHFYFGSLLRGLIVKYLTWSCSLFFCVFWCPFLLRKNCLFKNCPKFGTAVTIKYFTLYCLESPAVWAQTSPVVCFIFNYSYVGMWLQQNSLWIPTLAFLGLFGELWNSL